MARNGDVDDVDILQNQIKFETKKIKRNKTETVHNNNNRK